jgi:hypothetical protein
MHFFSVDKLFLGKLNDEFPLTSACPLIKQCKRPKWDLRSWILKNICSGKIEEHFPFFGREGIISCFIISRLRL